MKLLDLEQFVSDLNDFESLILGKKLGFGIHRDVYEFYFNDKYVIKVANCTEGRANNQLEYKIWDEIEYTDYKKWFAECKGVSTNGKYLIQEKINISQEKKYPTLVPHFFTDIKRENFGYNSKGKFVCCDYSLTKITNGITKKMKKVKWD